MGCFEFLRERLFEQLLMQKDTFPEQCRKLMTILSLSALMLPVVTIPYLVSASFDATSPGNVTNSAGLAVALAGLCLMFCFTFIPVYIFVRRTGDAPVWLFDLLILVSNLTLVPVTIGIRGFPTQPNLILFGVWVVFSGTPRLGIHLAHIALHYLLASYNHAVSGSSWFVLELNDAYLGHPGGRFLQQLIGYANVGTVLFIAVVMYRQLLAAVISAQTAVKLAHKAAGELLHYDIDEVRNILEYYDTYVDDKPLLAVFGRLTDNLEEYRPYLPNWLLFSAERADGQEEEEEDDEDMEMIDTTTLSSIGSRKTGADKKSSATADPDEESIKSDGVSRATETRSRVSVSTRNQAGRPVAMGRRNMMRRRSNATLGDMRSHASAASAASHANFESNDRCTAQIIAARCKNQEGEVTVALAVVNFTPNIESVFTWEQKMNTLDSFVERVSDLAHLTSGIIHSWVAGQVILSWGAFPVVRPEAKAAKFLLALTRDSLDPKYNMKVSGACLTGMAETIIASGRTTNAFLVDCSWWRCTQDCAVAAATHDCFFIDAKTQAGSQKDYDSRLSEIVYCPSTIGDSADIFTTNTSSQSGSQSHNAATLSTGGVHLNVQSSLGGVSNPGSPVANALTPSAINLPGVFCANPTKDTKDKDARSMTVNGKQVKAYQLYVILKEHKEELDEWMYELEADAKKTPDKTIEEAMDRALDGHFEEARDLLEGIKDDKAVSTDRHFKRNLNRVHDYISGKIKSTTPFGISVTIAG